MANSFGKLQEAISIAARAHAGQSRKDGTTPYVAHPMRVCLVVRQVFGVDDHDLLIAAVLHDTIEDTTVDFDDIAERFGIRVATLVAALTKDKRIAEAEREERYSEAIARLGWEVQILKLADVYDNLCDSDVRNPNVRAKSLARSRFYLDRIKLQLQSDAERAWAIVDSLHRSLTDKMRAAAP